MRSPLYKRTYFLSTGTVQCVVCRDSPFYVRHFGRAQYDRDKPVLSDYIREQARPIVDRLNAGELTIEAAEKLLDRI